MSKPSSYRPSVDLARFMACFGIVAAHAFAMEDDWIGHLALGLFLVLTAFLAVQSMQRAGGSYPFVARAKRLVLPWLFWSAFFRLVLLKVSDAPDKFQLLTDPWTLLIGSMIHLWFLPFVMLAMALVEPVGRLVSSQARLAVALSGLVAASVPMFWALHAYATPAPITQWLFSLPLYGLGLLIGVAHPMRRALWPILAAAVMSAAAFVVTNGAPYAWTIFASVLVFEAFWRVPMQGKRLPKLGQVSFGVYLLHPFFMFVTYKVFGGGVDRLFATLLTFAMTWAAVAALRKIPFFVRLT